MGIKEAYEEYVENLRKGFEEEEIRKMILLKIAVLMNPILKELKIGFHGSLAIVIQPFGIVEKVLKQFQSFNEEVFSTADNYKKICKAIENAEYEAAAFIYKKGANSTSNLEFLNALAMGANFKNRNFNIIPLIAFDTPVPEEIWEYFAGQVQIKGTTAAAFTDCQVDTKFVRELITFICENLPLFYHELEQKFTECSVQELIENNVNMEPFCAAKIITELMFHKIFAEDMQEQQNRDYQKALQEIADHWQFQSYGEEWIECFRHSFYEYAVNLPGILEREHVLARDYENIDIYPAYDDQYYYLSVSLFNEICTSLQKVIGIHNLKSTLVRFGVIKKEGTQRNYYTKSVPYITEYGVDWRHKVCIFRKAVDRPGDISWLDLIKSNRCEDGYGNPTLGNVFGIANEIHISSDANNQHLLILGDSGTGKTVSAKRIEKGIAEQGAAVIVLNYNRTHSFSSDDDSVRVINAFSDGIPISLLRPLESESKGTEHLETIIAMFSIQDRMGSNQQAVFRSACKLAYRNVGKMENEIKLIKNALLEVRNGKELIRKYGEILDNANFVTKGNLWEPGKITVLDFSEYSQKMQIILTNLVLYGLWYKLMAVGQSLEKPVWIVCDEFHALDRYGTKMLEKILREGRKFKTFLMLITQSISSYDKGLLSILQLASTKLYFKPVENDVRAWAKSISTASGISELDAMELLMKLKKGECIAVGNFAIGQSKQVRALKMKFKKN